MRRSAPGAWLARLLQSLGPPPPPPRRHFAARTRLAQRRAGCAIQGRVVPPAEPRPLGRPATAAPRS